MTIRKNLADLKNIQIKLKSFNKIHINKFKIIVRKIKKKKLVIQLK